MIKLIFALFLLALNLYSNTLEQAKDLFDNQQKYEEAIEIFEKYFDDGESKYYLGKAYLYGMGVEKNEKKAFEFAKQSASINNSSGLNLLGVLYQNGDGVQKDELQALIYYKQSVNLGNTKAMKNIGRMYFNSDVFSQDKEKAKEWFLKAVERGDLFGYLDYADKCFEHSFDEDALEYYLLFEKYYTKDDIVATFFTRIGWLYYNAKRFDKAYRYILKSTQMGDFSQTFKLYDMIKNKQVSQKYLDESIKWLKKSANPELNKTDSLNLSKQLLSIYYKYDKKNDSFGYEEFALNEYKNGNIKEGCNLASHYSNNLKELKFNSSKSFKIINEVINNYPLNHDTSACYTELAYLYRKGDYLIKDLNKAIEIFKLVSEKIYADKDELILEQLAKIYYEELNDIENSIKWFQKLYDLRQDDKYLQIIKSLKKIDNSVNTDIGLKKDNRVFPTLNNFTKKEQVVSVLETKEYFFFAVNDKSIKMYDKNSLNLLKEFRPWVSYNLDGTPLQMAFDENKKLLYFSVLNSTKEISKNDFIHVIDIDSEKIIKTLNNDNSIKNIYLNISSDGKYLVAINNYNLFNIINTENNKIQHYNFNGKGNFIAASIAKEGEDYIAYFVNKDDKKIYKFSLNQKRNISIEDFSYQTKFKTVNTEQAIKIFNNTYNTDFSTLVNNFNFENLDIKNVLKSSTKVSSKILKLNEKYNGQVIEFQNLKNKINKEYLLFNNVNILNSYPINNKYLLLVTTDVSFMPILNGNGDVVANLQGFNTLQKNIYLDNDRLITSGDDNIIHIFDLKNLDNLKYNDKDYDEETLNGFIKVFGDSKEEIISNFENMDEQNLKYYKKSNSLSFTPTKEQIKNIFKLFASKKEIIKPIASLYIKNENDWIIYTPEGLFTYGGEGYKLLKYHQNQGLYKEAKIIENEKLFDKFYRPDLIKKILAGEKVEIPMDVKSVILNIFPPELNILVKKMLNSSDVELTYQVCDAGNGIADLKLLINGQAITPPKSRDISIQQIDVKNDKCKTYKTIHTLYPGISNIELKAYDKDKNIANTSDKIKINADYKIIEKSSDISNDEIEKLEKNGKYTVLEKGDLHFLSLAVSDYEDKKFNLTYPVKDVISVKQKVLNKSKSVFKNIYTYDLHNKKVSKKSIDDIFDEMSSKMKINDTFILYIAGHGSTIDGKYQFIPYKIDEKVSIDNIKENLSKIAAYTNKSLVLLDTCYSGAIIENIDDKATANRLAFDSSSINFIVASASNQVALEGYKDHGVFTYSVLDAFLDKELEVSGLAKHVSEIVPKITKEKFSYEQRPQTKLNKNFELVGDKN